MYVSLGFVGEVVLDISAVTLGMLEKLHLELVDLEQQVRYASR